MEQATLNAHHFGVLGHSWEGASLCWREFCQHSTQTGRPDHPDLTMDCISFEHAMPKWDAGDLAGVRQLLTRSIDRLAAAGATFFACPDNTAHLALEHEGPDLALPGLHIVEEVAAEAERRGYSKVGVLGTKYTMDGPLYPRELSARGIEAVVPSATDRAMINETIFGELVHGRFTPAARARFVDVIQALAGDGCDAVALVCTEIPLLVTPDVSPLPTLDSTRLLARAACDVAWSRRPFPTWQQGQPGISRPLNGSGDTAPRTGASR